MNRRVLAAALFSLVPAFAAAQDETPKRLFWEAEENIGLGLFQSVSLSPLPSLRSGLGPRESPAPLRAMPGNAVD